MQRRRWYVVFPALLLLPALVRVLGGWAVITVDQLPDHLAVGAPVTLGFMVRQHGLTPLDKLSPRLEARASGQAVTAAVTPGKAVGEYLATFTIPQPGDWTITILSGFGNSKVTLLPIQALAKGASPAALSDAERGRRLFVAKGCVSCHIRNEMDVALEGLAPVLSGRKYSSDSLLKFLANPASVPSRTGKEMPNLGLKPAELTALAAYINSERSPGSP